MTGAFIQDWNDQLVELGLSLPTQFDANSALIVSGIAAALWFVGWIIGTWLHGRMVAVMVSREFALDEERSRRLAGLFRFGVIALLQLVLFNLWPWDRLSIVLVGLALAMAATLFINRVARLLTLPKWAAILLAVTVFVLIISHLLGGVQPVLDTLDRIGFDAGGTRISIKTVVTSAIVLIILFAVVRVANRITKHSVAANRSLDDAQKVLAQKLVGIAITTVAFFIGIDVLGIDLTALAVFSGALGLAIGFGFQKTFGNLISGIILLMDRSIKPGDVIVVGDSFGAVNKIGIRAVSVVTRDGKEHLIPNENLMTNEVENWSYSSRDVRVRIPVGVSYSADMDLVETLMLKAANDSPRVLAHPGPTVWMREFGDNSVNFELLAWINDPEVGVGNVQSDVLKRLWKLFKEHAVELPYPQQDMHLRDVPPELLEALLGRAKSAD